MNSVFYFFLGLLFFFSSLGIASPGNEKYKTLILDLNQVNSETASRLIEDANQVFEESEIPVFLFLSPLSFKGNRMDLLQLSAAAAAVGNLDLLKQLEKKLGKLEPHKIYYGNRNHGIKYTLFQITALNKSSSALSMLEYLYKKNPNPNHFKTSSETGVSPFFDAISMGNKATVMWMLDKKPDLVKERYDKRRKCTPFHFAVRFAGADDSDSMLNYLKDLLKKSSYHLEGSSHLNLPREDGTGITPFLDAAANGNRRIIDWIVKENPDALNQTTSQGLTAVHAALIGDHFDLASYLLNLWKLLVERDSELIKKVIDKYYKHPENPWFFTLIKKKENSIAEQSSGNEPVSSEEQKLKLISPTEANGLNLLHMATAFLDISLIKKLLHYYGVSQVQIQTKKEFEYEMKWNKDGIATPMTIPAGFKATQIIKLLQVSIGSIDNEVNEISLLLEAAELVHMIEKAKLLEINQKLLRFKKVERAKIISYMDDLMKNSKGRAQKKGV